MQTNNTQLLNYYTSQQCQLPKHYAKMFSVCVCIRGRGSLVCTYITIYNHWYLTQILMVTFLTVTNLTLLYMITDIWWERTTSYITLKAVQSELKNKDNGEGCLRLQQRSKFWEWWCYLHFGRKNRWQQQTRGFISSLVIDKMPSLLRHDSSEQLPLLDCMCDQNNSRRPPTFPHMYLDLNWDCGESTSDGRFSGSQNI